MPKEHNANVETDKIVGDVIIVTSVMVKVFNANAVIRKRTGDAISATKTID